MFFFRTGQNWGNRAYFPRAEKSFTPEEVLASFLAQFYDDKPPPKLILLSHDIEECELLAEALCIKAGHKVEILGAASAARRRSWCAHALTNAREALGRKLADTATQTRLLQGAGRPRSGCRSRRSGSRSTTTATSRAPTRSAR